MKLKATTTGAEKQAQKEENVRRGKNAKRKGGQYERDIAKKFQKSEKADDYRGDITIVDTKQMLLIHIECKNQKTWQLKQWIEQAESDCPEGRIPVVIFHQHNSSKDYVCLSLEDFFSLVEKDKVVGKRVFKNVNR